MESTQILVDNGIDFNQVKDTIHRSTNLLKYIKAKCNDPN